MNNLFKASQLLVYRQQQNNEETDGARDRNHQQVSNQTTCRPIEVLS